MTMRRVVLGWVLLALVCAQALGLVHRSTHLSAPAALASAHALANMERSGGSVQGAGWTQALFAHDDESGCRLFDGVGQCGAPLHVAAPLASSPPAAAQFALADAGFIERQPSPFRARAPPVSR